VASRLKKEDITYLALEGGGGKGFAYLGALQLLDDNKVLGQLKGVAGASAGAITALMLSLGMDAKAIGKEINEKDFTAFFDDPRPRRIPQPTMLPGEPTKYGDRPDSQEEQSKLRSYLDASSLRSLIPELLSDAKNLGPGNLPGWIVWAGIAPLLRGTASLEDLDRDLANLGAGAVLDPPFPKILANWKPYFTYLERDMGLFSGFAARDYFDGLIAGRAAEVAGGDPSKYRNLPFIVHQQIFKRELLVCAANLSTGKTVLFSARKEHTPLFPVADAVRMSMSLPLIYKPYVITKKVLPGWPPCGTYVDGGLWNNIPLREIEPVPAAFQPAFPGQRPPPAAAQQWPSKTLALRLQVDEPTRVMTALDVMTQMLKGGMTGTGESQVLGELEYMCVTLDTRDLSLLKFKPDDATNKKVTKRSRRAISRYFGWAIDIADQDPDDDKETEKLQNQSVCDP